MRGVFLQTAGQPHVELRHRLLGAMQPPPAPRCVSAAPAGDVAQVGECAAEKLATHGVAVIQLDRPLNDEEYITFGALLGEAQPERAQQVQAYVENEVILNLVMSGPATVNPDLQPFSANWVSLHSESSGAPAASQPRFICLMCITPGDDKGTAATVIVPMQAVCNLLPPRDQALLVNTYYDHGSPPPILRTEQGRRVLSVRDFQDEPLRWIHRGQDGAAEEIEGALTRLYLAMYSALNYGVVWRRGLLVVIDNTVFLHGRTASLFNPSKSPRHLKRLRLREHVAAG